MNHHNQRVTATTDPPSQQLDSEALVNQHNHNVTVAANLPLQPTSKINRRKSAGMKMHNLGTLNLEIYIVEKSRVGWVNWCSGKQIKI